MLRVLVLSTLFPNRTRPLFGTFVERQTLGLAARDDVEVRIVVPRGLPPAPLDRHSRYRADAALALCEDWQGVRLYRPRFLHLPQIGARYDARLMVRALTPLLREIRRDFAFDVIAAEYFFPDGPAAVELGRKLGVPVSIKARGSDINVWGKRTDTGPQVLAAGRAAGGMLAVSAAMKREMVALGMPHEKIHVHYTGVDRNLFHVRDRAEAKKKLGVTGPLVVTVAPLIARKGVDLVVKAMAQLPGATLVVTGAGPDEAMLRMLAAQYGVGDRVHLFGIQPRPVVADWLAAADVMALPSASEGLANAWVEALASGTPIVIADVGGASELVQGEAAGKLVTREAGAIAQAVKAFIANPPDRAAICQSIDRFSWETNRDALYDHLCAIVAAHKVGPQ
ncbi:MAG: glycosyltransferase [Pseudomonadota bacterium]|mgnify:CR=1 FL=1